jgi:hypothetical protein
VTFATGAGGRNALESYAGIRHLSDFHLEIRHLLRMGEPRAVNPWLWQRKDAIVYLLLNAQVDASPLRKNQRFKRPKYPLIVDGVDIVNHAHIVIRTLKNKQTPLRNGGRRSANLNTES